MDRYATMQPADFAHIVGNYLKKNGWKRDLTPGETAYAAKAQAEGRSPQQAMVIISEARMIRRPL